MTLQERLSELKDLLTAKLNKLWAEIKGIEIGGRNLIPNSNFIVGLGQNVERFIATGYVSIDGYDREKGVRFKVTISAVSSRFEFSATMEEKEVYTYSFVTDNPFVSDSSNPENLTIINVKTVDLGDGWFKHITVFKPINPISNSSLRNYYGRNYELGETFHLKYAKLEKGNKATDWTPAPEDQVTDYNQTDVEAFNYLKGKPTKLSQFTNDLGNFGGYLVAADIANKAEKATLISTTATSGLQGGGSLAANRSLSVKYGTVANTSVQGNDIRLVEAFAKKVNAISVTGDTNKTITLTRQDGTTLTASFLDGGGEEFPDDVLNTLTFNLGNDGVLRAVTSEGAIITVSLDGRYSLLNHVHEIADITGLQDLLDAIEAEATAIPQFSGDVLNNTPGNPKLLRVQGTFVSQRNFYGALNGECLMLIVDGNPFKAKLSDLKTFFDSYFDKYDSFNLKINDVQKTTVKSGTDLDLIAGTNMTISYGAGGKVTFNATGGDPSGTAKEEAIIGTREDWTGSGAKNIDWNAFKVFRYILNGNTTLSDINLPTGTDTKVIELIITGSFTLDFPSYWTAIVDNDTYDGTKQNHIVVSCIDGTNGNEMVYYTLRNL